MFRIRVIFLLSILVLIFGIASELFGDNVSQNVRLIFVTSPNSSHCEQAVSLMNEFVAKGYCVQTISVAQYPEVIKRLNITQLPTFILVQNDKIIDRVDGGAAAVVLKPMIQGMFDRVDRGVQKNVAQNIIVQPSETSINNFTKPKTQPPTQPTTQPPALTSASAETSVIAGVAGVANAIANTSERELLNRKFITSSVKLRVDSANGHSWGSGTIVDTRKGDALILTCGHIFREAGVAESDGKIIVEVHLYGENSSVKVYGRCIYYDLEIDLAFVVIVPPCPVQAIPVAPSNLAVNAGQNVISVGCDSGADPTIRKHSIMSIDRIGTPTSNKLPFHYIQVSGAPVGGRSGGGLFSDDGYLIGVCNTADPVRNDGHFVPPEIIRQVLDQQKLSIVYKNPSLQSTQQIPNTENFNNTTVNNNHANSQPQPQPASSPLPEIAKPFLPFAAQPEIQNPNLDNLTPIERATLSEVKRRVQDGDEVILIVRSRRNSEIPSDVIVLNNTSEQFLDNLTKQSPTNSAPANQIILSSQRNQSQETKPLPVTFDVLHK